MTEAFDLSQAEFYSPIKCNFRPPPPQAFFTLLSFPLLQHRSSIAYKISLFYWGLECSAKRSSIALKLCGSLLLGSHLRKWSGFTER